MNHFKRHIHVHLNNWKTRTNRKPLILRGARQVGKTTLIHDFSNQFKYKILLNLEKKSDKSYFVEFNDVHKLIDAIFFNKNIPGSEIQNTLLFIDEIQESPEAISFLRYFYEEIPELYVIAAGSLLEFAMKKVKNFPVGRVEFLYLHPLNFLEFINAFGHQKAKEQINSIPIDNFSHKTMVELFNQYAIIGGMPEIINNYIITGKIADLPRIYESIWGTYKNDVEKYSTNETERRIAKHILKTAPFYVDQRIKFQNFGKSNYRSREVGETFKNLDDAKILRLIYPTTDISPPIYPDIRKTPRLQILDTGILNYTLGIQTQMLAMEDLSNTFKGAVIPNLIAQEILSLNTIHDNPLNFWVREKHQSSAEVDIVLSYQNLVIPVEIKSGKTGTLKSLHQFIDMSPHPYAIRIYAGEFNVEKHKTPKGTQYLLMNLPYYLGTKIYDYLDYFISNYNL